MWSKQDLVKLRASVVREMRSFFDNRGHVETFPPELTAGPGSCENIRAIFTLPYFTRLAYLSQTSQLYLESYLADMDIDRVYTMFRSFRAEAKADSRRLAEFSLFEFEERDLSLEGLMNTLEGMLRHVFRADGIRDTVHPVAQAYVDRKSWARLTYTDAVRLIQRSDPRFAWGQDFSESEESLITREFGITFVTHYPTCFKFFNMKLSRQDQDVVEACDVLLPNVGESVGGSVRESDVAIIRRRLSQSPILTELPGIKAEDFEWYLQLFEGRKIERAGAGIGFERLIQFILQESDIHRCVEFPRDATTLVP